MTDFGRLYEFVYRGHLAEVALDRGGRPISYVVDQSLEDISQALSVDLFDPEDLDPARRMAVVYTVIAAFENSVRRFVMKVLIDAHGEGWWESSVSEKIRKFAESRRDEEEKTKWHGIRGEGLLSYTEMGQLVNVMQQNWTDFEPYVRRVDWATSIFGAIERSRNVIMHSGILATEDMERLGIYVRDWIKQVGL